MTDTITMIIKEGVYWVPPEAVVSWRPEEIPLLDDVTHPTENDMDKLQEFVENVGFSGEKNVWLLSAYEVEGCIVTNQEPMKLQSVSGPGFNHGSCNAIHFETPGTFMIIAAND